MLSVIELNFVTLSNGVRSELCSACGVFSCGLLLRVARNSTEGINVELAHRLKDEKEIKLRKKD